MEIRAGSTISDSRSPHRSCPSLQLRRGQLVCLERAVRACVAFRGRMNRLRVPEKSTIKQRPHGEGEDREMKEPARNRW